MNDSRGLRWPAMLLASAATAIAAAHPGDACFEAIRGRAPDAVETCRAGAMAGDALSQYNLAMLRLDRDAGAHDPAAARRLLEQAAGALPIAGYALATLLLESGEREAGYEWLRRAADAGVVDAQYDFATALLEQPVPNPTLAARYYEMAARNGDTGARFNLAMLLLSPATPAHDAARGLAWLYTLGELPNHDRVARLTRRYEAELDDATIERARALLAELM